MNIAENEKKYDMESSDFFNTDSGIFGNTRSLVSLSGDGYVVIPKNAAFEDLTSEINYDDKNDNSLAKITYKFGDVYVGETDLLLSESNVKTYVFGETVSEDKVEEVSDNNHGFGGEGIIFVDIHRVLKIAAIIVGGLFLFLLIILFIKNYFFSAQRRRRKIRKKHRRYFSEFDDFDF